ncbi:MAG: type III polyketide synthase [Anaerolineae bacterium]|nr:type III polyketide synthase [Anaerolineae bacterium]
MKDVRIVSLATANPPLRVSQEESYQAYVEMLPLSDRAKSLLQRIFVQNNSIGYRHFGMDALTDILHNSQDELIARYRKFAVPVSVEAARQALDRAGLAPADVDAVVINSCTGYLCPGLTSYVAEALPLRPDVWPFDLQGMGCGGAVPNLETAHNYLQAHPDHNVLAIAVEICSATIYFDEAPDILVSNALFGDGAAAAVLTNRAGEGGIRLAGFAAGLYPQDRQHLYYRTENSKLRNVLSVDVPAVGARRGKEVIDRLLAEKGLGYGEIDHWLMHPGGQKVLDALEDGLSLPAEALTPSRNVLYRYGNMSSVSVLFVLDELLRNHAPRPGDRGVVCSFGAGFGAYATLLEFL